MENDVMDALERALGKASLELLQDIRRSNLHLRRHEYMVGIGRCQMAPGEVIYHRWTCPAGLLFMPLRVHAVNSHAFGVVVYSGVEPDAKPWSWIRNSQHGALVNGDRACRPGQELRAIIRNRTSESCLFAGVVFGYSMQL